KPIPVCSNLQMKKLTRYIFIPYSTKLPIFFTQQFAYSRYKYPFQPSNVKERDLIRDIANEVSSRLTISAVGVRYRLREYTLQYVTRLQQLMKKGKIDEFVNLATDILKPIQPVALCKPTTEVLNYIMYLLVTYQKDIGLATKMLKTFARKNVPGDETTFKIITEAIRNNIHNSN